MKKTIAILLVLVIGMAGMFADTAVLDISTTVPIHDEIILTNTGTSSYSWGNAGVVNDSNNDLVADLSNTWDSTTSAQEIAYIHGRSNRTGGFSVTAKATALSMNDGTELEPVMEYIGYDIVAGSASITVAAAAGDTPLTGKVMQVSPVSGEPFASDSKLITVKPAGSNIDYKQGTYSADITFEIAAF